MQSRIMRMLALGLICLSQQSTQAEGSDGACSIKAALKNLPQLEYRVGTTTTTCSKSAIELSKKEGTPVKYIVAKREYKDKAAATLALAEQTEALVKQFSTTTKCEVSGTISIGGQKLECSKKAAATAKRIQDAIDAVKVSYKVGDKLCDCPIESKKLSAESKTNIVFVVDGKETTCPIGSRLNAARAKYRAAVEAVANVK